MKEGLIDIVLHYFDRTDSYNYYSKTWVKWPLSKRPKIGFQDQLSLNAGQKHCRMLQEERRILQPFDLH